MPPIARFREEIRYLNTPTGVSMAQKLLDLTPEEIEMIVGRYTRGHYEGTLRGALVYDYCYYGGWKAEGPGEYNGHVVRPGTILNPRIVDSFTRKEFPHSEEAAEVAHKRRTQQYEIEHKDELQKAFQDIERRRNEHTQIIEMAQHELDVHKDFTPSQVTLFEGLIKSSKEALARL